MTDRPRSAIHRHEIVARLRAAGCVFADEEARLLVAAASGAELERLVAARSAGTPLEHLLGKVQFCGREFAVTSGVFVPRRRTEFLVERAAALTCPGDRVLELCCGCGAAGAALAAAVGRVELHAVDVEPVAVACAARNVARFGGTVHRGNLFAALPSYLAGSFAVILANAPYVPTAQIARMPPEARDFEPRVALDGGVDGLDMHRRIAAQAASWLAPHGRVLVETSQAQAEGTASAFADNGYATLIERDRARDATVVTARVSARWPTGDRRPSPGQAAAMSDYVILVHYGEDEPPARVPLRTQDRGFAEAKRQALVSDIDHALEMDAPLVYSDATGDDPEAGVPLDPRRVTTIELVDEAPD